MDQYNARELLENLLERARASSDKVFLTRREIDAIEAVLELKTQLTAPPVASAPENDSTNDTRSAAATSQPPQTSLAPIIVSNDDITSEVMLCIDFGTSFSKAFVSRGNEDSDLELIDLAIGDGTTGSRLTTPSELFIDGTHIYFGSHARDQWDYVQAPPERLIDSIKQFITLNQDVSTLSQRPMLTSQDPQQLFSQRDVLALYLAHLMALTEEALRHKQLPENLRRRFTHPAWKDDAKEKNGREMRQLMAEAVVLARSAETEFKTSMPLSTARRLLDQLLNRDPALLPMALIGEPVREATAAGAGALLATKEGKREAYLILDIGAGTTDVAGFYCVNNPNAERMRVFEVSSAADAKNIAGNALDSALQRLVLEKSGLSPDTAEARLAGHAIRRQIRSYKEQLFRAFRVSIALPTDQIIEVTLDEFQKYPPIVSFNKIITDLVATSAIALAGDMTRVNLVATGGGANLPIVHELSEKGITLGGRSIGFNLLPAMAGDVQEKYPDLIDPYPQIAVALGGSLPQLPEQRVSIVSGLETAPIRTLTPMYRT